MASKTGMFLSDKDRESLMRELKIKGEVVCDAQGTIVSHKTGPTESDFGTGCLACGADDDHANLMLCEGCNGEYHTYCLTPPLRAVPAGDWYCEKCKTRMEGFIDDGLDALICALPPAYTARFGEVCWAQGGVGFGWWPSFIYDPRLTVGNARQLARKHLGKRHLVYFFECHDAPFAVLAANKICTWEMGLVEDYHLGKTAKAHGKARTSLFQQALEAATVEYGKPVEMRLDWNHHSEQPQILPSPRPIPSTPTAASSKPTTTSSGSTGKGSNTKGGKKRRRNNNATTSPTTPETSKGSSNESKQKEQLQTPGAKQTPTRKRKPQSQQSPAPATETENITDRPQEEKQQNDDNVQEALEPDNLKTPTASTVKTTSSNSSTSSNTSGRKRRSGFAFLSKDAEPAKRTNINAAVKALSNSTEKNDHNNNSNNSSDNHHHVHIESSEDSDLYCKLLRRLPTHGPGDIPVNIGFCKLPSRKTCSFADARVAITDELVPDCLPPTLDWKFLVPGLGPVSSKQEASLGPLWPFLQSSTADPQLGNGSLRDPLKLIIVDVPVGIVAAPNRPSESGTESKDDSIHTTPKTTPSKKNGNRDIKKDANDDDDNGDS